MSNPCPTCGSARDELESDCSACGWRPPKLISTSTSDVDSDKASKSERWSALRFIWPLCFSLYCLAIIVVPLTRSIYYHYQARLWVPVEATVWSIPERPKGMTVLTYDYEFGNSRYSGRQFAFLSKWGDSQRIVDNYQPAQAITIFVDPNAPENSVVLRRDLTFRFVLPSILMVLLLLIVNGIISLTWVHHRRKLLAATWQQ